MKNYDQRALNGAQKNSGKQTSTAAATPVFTSHPQRSVKGGESTQPSEDLHDLPSQAISDHESTAILGQQWKNDLEEVMNFVTTSIALKGTEQQSKGKTDFDDSINNEKIRQP